LQRGLPWAASAPVSVSHDSIRPDHLRQPPVRIPNFLYLTRRFPPVVIFGPRSRDAAFRCRFCCGRVKPSPTVLPYADPVCANPNTGGAGHHWVFVANPITNFLRREVEGYWSEHCKGDPKRLNSSELRHHRSELNKLFVELEPLTFPQFGVFIRVQFEVPPKATAGRE
jgi:hypothetical protein